MVPRSDWQMELFPSSEPTVWSFVTATIWIWHFEDPNLGPLMSSRLRMTSGNYEIALGSARAAWAAFPVPLFLFWHSEKAPIVGVFFSLIALKKHSTMVFATFVCVEFVLPIHLELNAFPFSLIQILRLVWINGPYLTSIIATIWNNVNDLGDIFMAF